MKVRSLKRRRVLLPLFASLRFRQTEFAMREVFQRYLLILFRCNFSKVLNLKPFHKKRTQTDWAEIVPPMDLGLQPILAVHDKDYVDFLQNSFTAWQVEGGQLKHQIGDVLMGTTFPPRRGQLRSNV